MTITTEELDRLSIEQRLRLIEVIWESLQRDVGELPLTEAQKRLLDERLAEYQRNPTPGKPWREALETRGGPLA